MFRILILTGWIFLASCSPGNQKPEKVHPNVLFICVDDLRPELGCYGNKLIISPNLDKLAEEGCLFTNHFVTTPTCGASRYSLLTGLIPRSGVELTNDAIRELISNQPEGEKPESFIHHLKRNGYYTVGIGKISHYADGLIYGYTEAPSDDLELPHSWNEMMMDPGGWENVAYSYFRKGISVRTERYRFTKYFRDEEPVIELYDHLFDPHENKNIAKESPAMVDSLMPVLEKGNTGLYR